jgi:hypothetical protein
VSCSTVSTERESRAFSTDGSRPGTCSSRASSSSVSEFATSVFGGRFFLLFQYGIFHHLLLDPFLEFERGHLEDLEGLLQHRGHDDALLHALDDSLFLAHHGFRSKVLFHMQKLYPSYYFKNRANNLEKRNFSSISMLISNLFGKLL